MQKSYKSQFLYFWMALTVLLNSSPSFGQAASSLTYTEDILPIFTSTCLDCHGPDESRRMLNLRLDTQDFLSSHIVAGDPENSLLFQRISEDDMIRVMPPSSSGRTLTQQQIQIVRDWIEGGADWGLELNETQRAELVEASERQVVFTREVRPILSRNCFQCHGPDEENRQMGLRLDTPEGFAGDRGNYGGPVVIPGNAPDSLLFQRITAEVENFRMPRDLSLIHI